MQSNSSTPAPSFTIFPLFGIVTTPEGVAKCACSDPGCDKPGKHPSVAWGKLVPGERIGGPAGHGVVTGYKSGIFVVDTDGWEADVALRKAYDVPETRTIRTPSGGRHYYFRWPGFFVKNSESKLMANVDVRGDGGYAVLEGSPHRSGKTYDVEYSDLIADAPAWLLEWPGLKGKAPGAEGELGANAPTPVDVTTDVGKMRVELGRQACLDAPAAADGTAGTTTIWPLAIYLVRSCELPLDVAHELISTVYNPRCTEADGFTRWEWSAKEIAHKLTEARDKSEKACGFPSPFDASNFGAPTPAPAPKRKQKNPAHRYTARIGDTGNMHPSTTTIGNVISLLATHVEWEGVLQYDAFRDRIIAVDPPIALQAEKTCFAEHDVTSVRCWFERVAGHKVAKDTAWDAVIGVARENSFHPVREYLEGLPTQSPALLENAARLFFGSGDGLDATLVAKFMVGAVRRILNPGEKMDNMLVLSGPQGVGKSTFVRALFGEDWTSEDLADLKSKDAMIGLAGKWAVEVAELDKILRTDPETVKAFLTRCVDPYRAPYERVSTDHPRQCVYVGTTNGEDFLKDPTGERRYWVVKVDSVNLAAVRANRDALWAAAYAAARLPKSAYPHWLSEGDATKLKERAASFESRDPWHEKVLEFLAGKKSVSVSEVWKHIGGMTEGLGRREQLRISDTLLRLGCDGFQQKGCKRYKVPAALSSQSPKRAPGDRPEVS